MSTWTRRLLLAAGVVFALGLSGLVCARVGARGRFALPYSTYGAGPAGARALYLLAAREGASPRRWTEDLGRLPPRAMLVALGGCEHLDSRPLARAEQRALVDWIEAGGTLVVAGASGYLPEHFGIRLVQPDEEACWAKAGWIGMVLRAGRRAGEDGHERSDGGSPPRWGLPDPFDVGRSLRSGSPHRARDAEAESEPPDPQWAQGVAPPFLGVPPIGLRRPADLVFDAGERAITPLLAIDDKPVAVEVRRGEGSVIAIASASPFQNRDLATMGGAELFSRLLRARGGGTVLFDEYHLGAGERRGVVRWIAQRGGLPLLMQMLIVVGLFLWWRGARFGAPRSDRPPEPEATASYVGAIGTLFEKSGDLRGAVAILAEHALVRIAAYHHLEARDAERVAEHLARRGCVEAAESVRAIAAIARQPPRHPVRAVRAIDDALSRAMKPM